MYMHNALIYCGKYKPIFKRTQFARKWVEVATTAQRMNPFTFLVRQYLLINRF